MRAKLLLTLAQLAAFLAAAASLDLSMAQAATSTRGPHQASAVKPRALREFCLADLCLGMTVKRAKALGHSWRWSEQAKLRPEFDCTAPAHMAGAMFTSPNGDQFYAQFADTIGQRPPDERYRIERVISLFPYSPEVLDEAYARVVSRYRGPLANGSSLAVIPAKEEVDVHLEKKWLAPPANSSIQLSGSNVDDIGTTCEPGYKAPKL
jgi:hypothetical protein